MQIVKYPILPPGKCAECGYGGRDRRYADTGIDVEFYGVVYVCDLCFTSWASDFGLGPVSEYRGLLDNLHARIGELENERDSLLGVIRAFEPSNPALAEQPTLPFTDGDEVEQPEGPLSPKFSQLSLK